MRRTKGVQAAIKPVEHTTETRKFYASILGHEAPVDRCAAIIAVGLLGGDFTPHRLGGRNAATQTLTIECTQFDFSDIEPAAVFWGVVDLKSFGQTASFLGRKGFVERSEVMGVEVIL